MYVLCVFFVWQKYVDSLILISKEYLRVSHIIYVEDSFRIIVVGDAAHGGLA
jgi:hypothetical protein